MAKRKTGPASPASTEPTSGDVGELQSAFAVYGANGAALPFELAPRHDAQRVKAAKALKILRQLGFRSEATRALLAALRTEVARDRIVAAWPKAGEDREALEEVANTAIKLRQQLLDLSPKAAMYLHSGAYDLKADDTIPDALLADLMRLAGCVTHAVRTYVPQQSRKGHHANVVEAVAQVARPMMMTISASPTSRFWRACVAAFDLADITSEFKGQHRRPSPGASIRALLESDSHRRRGKFWHLK
jgi:hypothetical protein